MALDQGTTSSRAIIFDEHQNIVNMAQKEFTQHYPKAGWVEHDPLEIYASQYGVLVEVLARSGMEAGEICGHRHHQPARDDHRLGQKHRPSGVQRHRVAVPPHRPISATKLVERGLCGLDQGQDTACCIDAYFCATKIKWILDNVEGARERAERGELLFGTVDTWLIWKLTGGAAHVTDVHQRLAHDAVQHPYAGMGQGYLCAARHSHVHAAQSLRFQHGVRCGATSAGPKYPSRARRATSRPPCSARACFAAGRCEKYIRHGLLSADEHRASTPVESKNGLLTTVAVGLNGQGDLCAGGQRVRGRGGHPVAAGRAEAHQRERRQRVFRKQGEGQRRACMWCPPSPGWARRTGICTPGAPSWG